MQYNDEKRGLIWFILHQIYYLPLGSWMGEPFFFPDSEMMFKVSMIGRVTTGLIYIVMIFFLRSKYRKILHILKNTKSSSKR